LAKAGKDAATAIPDSAGVVKKLWIDPSIAAWRPGPWRKVHIEYHTSRHIPRIAERFDADEFGDRLVAAHVNGATLFAKDMYGYSYFPSAHGRMHPNLSFDLLGKQVAALRKRRISVLAYHMLTWNPELAERHPEWLVVHRPGGKSRPKLEEISEEQKAFMNTLKLDRPSSKNGAGAKPAPAAEDKGYRPYMWQFCICQEGFLKGELDLIRDLVSKYELDGVWLDGCTVIFKDFWADFGGLKSPAQMHTEAAAFVAQGARCDIGDQVPPDGRLEPAVYHVIGRAYQHIERIEPYLERAAPVTEASLLASGDAPCNEVNFGWVKLLNESHLQFDIVERDTRRGDRYLSPGLSKSAQ
jgi:hypothetical protein